MIYRQISFDAKSRSVHATLMAFLRGRLEERDTIWWALNIHRNDVIARQAVLDTLNEHNRPQLKEPWNLAWRLIEEYWGSVLHDVNIDLGDYTLRSRLQNGDRSGSLVNAITDFVAPKLKIEKFSEITLKYTPLPKRVSKIEDLFSVSLASGELRELDQFGFDSLDDASFLFSLAQSLDAAVTNGLDIARRLGWNSEYLWKLGGLNRVYYVPESERPHEHEPDEFSNGIAPAVKLLFTIVTRLAELDINSAKSIVQRWKSLDSPVYRRLWAAMARNPLMCSDLEVSEFLLSMKDNYFWDKSNFPEIAELRAKRFNALNSQDSKRMIQRLQKGPPRSFWSKKLTQDKVKEYTLHIIATEFHRIDLAGWLPDQLKPWFKELQSNYTDIVGITSVDGDFYKTPKARSIPSPAPDNRFDLLQGHQRLSALESALSSVRSSWSDKTSSNAFAWVNENSNYLLVLQDLISHRELGNSFPNVWERIGWIHKPNFDETAGMEHPRNLSNEAHEVISMLIELKSETIRKAIDGLSEWVLSWSNEIKDEPRILSFWGKIWPIAVQATNALQKNDEVPDLNTIAISNASVPQDLDTLNTPAGRMMELFLSLCPNLDQSGTHNLHPNSNLRKLADQISSAPGRAGLIGKHRMIEHIGYFLRLDPAWTEENLIASLKENSATSLPLWRAIARKTLYSPVLKHIGVEVLQRVLDDRLDRTSRNNLLFSLILECLNALYEQEDPVISFDQIQQLIRNLDDESRAHGLQTIIGYIQYKGEDGQDTPEKKFRKAIVPFLNEVWPQERSFATSASSKILAKLPAAAGKDFIKAVSLIERFLVPFSCWSMLDYGLYGVSDDKPKIALINTVSKANALLKLLGLTIATSEVAVIPHELPQVLQHLKNISPEIANNFIFRRLATQARRI